jgi:hypothetical protein
MAQRLSIDILEKHNKRTFALVKKVIETTNSKRELAKAMAWCAIWGETGLYHKALELVWKHGEVQGFLPKTWQAELMKPPKELR